MMRLRHQAGALIGCTPIPEMLFRKRALNAITVIAYHRIHTEVDGDYPFDEELFSATPIEFTRELRFFRRHLDVMTMSDLALGLRDPRSLPSRPAIITFDDGYEDNHRVALPLLKEQALTACFFLCTRLVGSSTLPWYEQFVCCLKHSKTSILASPFGDGDPPYALNKANLRESIRRYRRNLRRIEWSNMDEHLMQLAESTGVTASDYLDRPLFMSWDAAQAMVSAGMELGGHTRRHPILSRVADPAVLRDEIAGCWSDLGERVGRAPTAFAFPVGGPDAWSAEAESEVRRAGFEISFSYVNNLAPRAPESWQFLPRVHSEFGRDYRAFRLAMARIRQAGAPGSNLHVGPAPGPA